MCTPSRVNVYLFIGLPGDATVCSIHGMGTSVALSGKGLTNVVLGSHSNEFTFIVGGKAYECPFFVAEFLSARVSTLRRTDCTVREFVVKSIPSSDCFSQFLALGFGSSVLFHPRDYPFIRSVCVELKSLELWDKLFRTNNGLSVETIVSELKYAELNGISCEAEIEFAASNFFRLSESSISRMSVPMLERILSRPSLKTESEDHIYGLISSLIRRDSNYSVLLEYVRYEYLSASSMGSFIDLISGCFDFLTMTIWKRFRSRLISGPPVSRKASPAELTVSYHSPFDGIIAYLTREYGGNVCDVGTVLVTASSVRQGNSLRNVVDFDSVSRVATEDVQNSWIQYDFRDRQVGVNHYSLRSRSDNDCHHLMNWVIEGSIDGHRWTVLDRHTDCSDLVGMGLIASYPVSGSTFFRMIRLRQFGKTDSDSNILMLSAFELFGVLVPR
jgi:hypothetical protein